MSAVSLRPKTRERAGARAPELRYIAKKRPLTYEQVKTLVNNLLREVLDSVVRELEEWIRSRVPKRTGQLRDSLLANLSSSRVVGGVLRLILGTSLDYAEYVDDMSTAQVRHSGEEGYAYYYGHYGRVALDDPQAVGNFFGRLRDYASRRVSANLAKAKARYLGPGAPLRSSDLAEVRRLG